jgi:hypothetical protein
VAEGLIFVLIQLKGEIELGNLLLDGDYFIWPSGLVQHENQSILWRVFWFEVLMFFRCTFNHIVPRWDMDQKSSTTRLFSGDPHTITFTILHKEKFDEFSQYL